MFAWPLTGNDHRSLLLEGPRVILRAPRSRDWRAWAALRRESRDFLVPWEPTWPHDALTRGAFRRRLRYHNSEWRSGSGAAFFIFHRTDGQLVGGVTLANIRRGVAQTGSLGYWVGARYARQGFMTEGLGLVLDYAFETIGLHRVEAACLPDNAASQALLQRLRFSREGYARQYLRINGSWRDHVLYGLLRADHRAQRNAGAGPAIRQAWPASPES
ncbi:MAG: GNAT family protein [Rhodovibrionaceae bacterium]|nr:GNAT family protein [Rhodovibrionaceae bacterium]